jgi:type I restriction enzyme R subunit
MSPFNESSIENLALAQLQALGYTYIHGPVIGPGGEQQERASFEEVVLTQRLANAVARLNPTIPVAAQEQAIRSVRQIGSPDRLTNNEQFQALLIEKIKVAYQLDGNERSHEVMLIDFDHPERNEYLAVNQFTITEGSQNKRPDVLLFVNGIPLVVIELKNAVSAQATIRKAYDQIQTYKATIPSLFTYNAICVISDGHECKAGTLTAGFSRYMAWKSADGLTEASRFAPELETLINGMLSPAMLLDLVRNFIVYEKVRKADEATGIIQVETIKKIAAYHQYYAVNKALESTRKASGQGGDRKGGVVWHTQGSGKSLSMVFYAGKLVQSLNNPTIVVITDRNDLDDQLFDTFTSCRRLLRQDPVQAQDRDHLRGLLKVASGGIVFTTVQKFMPDEGKTIYEELSERTNIVVIADEAHRTQYGFDAKFVDVKDELTKEVIGKRIAYGFAKYMRDALPNATYIGFTGTPVEATDKNTKQIFGQYVDIYDITQAVADGATVRIFYESRLAKVNLDEEGRKLIEEFDQDLDQSDEQTEKQKARVKWTQLEAIVGTLERLKNLAQDIVYHFEQRQQVFEGKAMIVAMSRRIAADLYNAIIAIRPNWHSDDLQTGLIKVVMTASSADGPVLQKLHTSKAQRKELADRMKDPENGLKLVIVCDMWLTGFDAPSMHTLYIDKPMRGHNLMQAIARVNRVFKDKPGGLVVDYLGIASDLKKALAFYTAAGGKGDPAETQSKAVAMLVEKMGVVNQMFDEQSANYDDLLLAEPTAYYGDRKGFNFNRFFNADPREKLSIILQAEEHILGLNDGKNRFIREVSLLSQAYALSIPHETALDLKDQVALFQAIKARLVKFESTGSGKSFQEYETSIRQIINDALVSDKVVDIFDAAGIKKPEISILSDEFMQEIRGMKHKNLALELLKKLLNDEIKVRSKVNLVKSKALLEMLESSIKKYQNNLLTTSEIIQELIDIAKEVKESDQRAKDLGLNSDEMAFFDALEVNDSAVAVLGDDQLRAIAREIAEKVRTNATIDWTIRGSARAKLMVIVRRTLKKYGYPPDKQVHAVTTIMKQAELLADYITSDLD